MTHTLQTLLARCEPVGDCQEWQMYMGSGRVPQVRHDGRLRAVRRVMLDLAGRTVRPGHYVGTCCGNARCVEPGHIRVHTPKQHSRLGVPQRNAQLVSARIAAARRAQASVLTIECVRAIRASDEPATAVATRYGVTPGAISRIRLGQRWRETASPFAGLGARS